MIPTYVVIAHLALCAITGFFMGDAFANRRFIAFIGALVAYICNMTVWSYLTSIT